MHQGPSPATSHRRYASGSLTAAIVPATILFAALLIVAASSSQPVLAQEPGPTLAQRVEAQQRVEEVYWRHRVWPERNPGPKPALASVMSPDDIRAKVEAQLAREAALRAHPGLAGMQELGGDYRVVTLALEEAADGNSPAQPRDGRRMLSPDEWDRQRVKLAERFDRPAGPRSRAGRFPMDSVSPLREEADRFDDRLGQ